MNNGCFIDYLLSGVNCWSLAGMDSLGTDTTLARKIKDER